MVITLYPCYFVLMASVSDPSQVYANGGLLLFPKNFSISSYLQVIKNDSIWIGYRNTIFYAISGGFLSVLTTVFAAYALTRKGLPGKNIIMFAIVFTMYFSGGLIPSYLVVKSLNLLNTAFAMILPGMITTYNLIVTVSYFRGLPNELDEAARVDGANDYRILLQIFVPIAKPVIAVIALNYIVAIWNNYFSAMIYLRDRDLYPLQMILREILILGNTDNMSGSVDFGDGAAYAEAIKYAVIVVSTLPVMCIYPFIQKYFVKGMVIGAVKG